MATHRLVPVETEREWDAYHAIRQHVLFELRGRFGVYDRAHPDERLPANHPLLLFLDDCPIGVVRVDLDPPIAYFRRVAVIPELQRMGHGTVMLELAERFVRQAGCHAALSNVDEVAVPFYEHLGFTRDADRSVAPSVPMSKRLGP